MGRRRQRDELDPAAVLAGKLHVDAPGLLRLIHRVNPTGLELPAHERAERYALKSRLQSLLIRRFGDSLTVVRDPKDEAIVGIRRGAFDDDACHAVIADLDDDGRRWVRDQLDMSAADPESLPAPAPQRRARVEATEPGDLEECSEATLLEIGERAIAAYDYVLARDAFERALDRSRGEPAAARALLALLVDHLGVDQDALDLQPRLSRKALAEPEVVLSLALAAARVGDEALARSLVATQRADGIAERVNDVFFALADRAISTNALADARRAIDEAHAHHPSDPRIAARLATLDRMARDARRPQEEALRQALASEGWDEARRLADEILAAWPESELARKVVRSLAERRAEAEADDIEAEVVRRRDAGDATAEASLLRSVVALRSPGPARDRAARRLADVEVEQAARVVRARVAEMSARLRDDRRDGLARYVAETAEMRGRVREVSHGIRELEWLDRMLSVRIPNDEALGAAAALGDAIDAVNDAPEAAMERLGPHLKALRSVPDASRAMREAEQRVLARGAAEREAILARAEALLARGDTRAAATLLDELRGSGAPASERRTAAGLREKIARAAAEDARDAAYARALRGNDPFTAHTLASQAADAADEATRGKWQRASEEAWNELRRALQIRIWRPPSGAAPPAADRIAVGRIVDLADEGSETAAPWVDASGRWLALVESHDRYVFVRAVDLEDRRLRWRLVLRTPGRLGYSRVWQSARGTLVIVGDDGALLELSAEGDVVRWLSGLHASENEVIERVAYTSDLRFLWAEVRTVGPGWSAVMRVIDVAQGRVVREHPSSWMLIRLNGQAEPTMVTAFDDSACTLHSARGGIRETIALQDNRALDVHPHPSGVGLLLLVGAPERDDERAPPLGWVEVDARGKPSAPTWIPGSDNLRIWVAAVAVADGLAFIWYREEGVGHLAAYRWEAGRAIVVWSFAIPERIRLRLVTDALSRTAGALVVGEEDVQYIRLGHEAPTLSFVEPESARIATLDYVASLCAVREPTDDARSPLWDKIRGMSDDAHFADLEVRGGGLAVEELVERHVAAVACYQSRAAAAIDVLLGTRAPGDARFALSAAELDVREKRWADARAHLMDVDLGTLEPSHRRHAHHLLALAELELDGAPAALRALTEAARTDGRCELAPLFDLARPLTGRSAAERAAESTPLLELRHVIDATDAAFAAADLERAKAIETAMVWHSDEVQALARLAELHLRRAPRDDDELHASTVALATFLEADRGSMRRELPLPGARWRRDRLDDIAARAERWLAEPPSPGPLTPAWRSVLDAIERAIDEQGAADDPSTDTRVAWRVHHIGRLLDRVEPVVQRRLRADRLSAGHAVDRISEASGLDAARILEALPPDAPLFLAGHANRAAVVRRATLRLELVAEDAGLLLSFGVGGSLFVAGELAPIVVDVDPDAAEITLARVDGRVAAFADALAKHHASFPPESHEALRLLILRLQDVLDVSMPSSLAGDEITANALPSAVITTVAPEEIDLYIAMEPLAGSPRVSPGRGSPRFFGAASGRRIWAARDLSREVSHAEALRATLSLASGPGWRWRVTGEQAIFSVVAALEAAAAAGLVTISAGDELPSCGGRITRSALQIGASREGDWLGLAGFAELDGERVALALLLEAVRKGERYVRAGNRTFFALDEELLVELAPLADLVFETERGLFASVAAATELANLCPTGARSIEALVASIRDAAALEPPLPDGFQAELRPYQREGYRWLVRLAVWAGGACLADEMGLGKTVQALALLAHRAALGPALVVAPTSLVDGWIREAARFAPRLRTLAYRGLGREALATDLRPFDVLVTSYDVLVRDAPQLAALRFATLVCDEAQAVKNDRAKRARAARALTADFRLVMSGTPLENHLGELWSVCRIAMPALLGTWSQFRHRFGAPIEIERNNERREALRRVLRPFLLRRTKATVLPELPPRIEVDRLVELSPEERALYDAARLTAARETQDGPVEGTAILLAWITRLRRLACHPRLYEPSWTGPAEKLRALVELVVSLRAGGHRALIFSQFTDHLAIAEDALVAAGVACQYLDGSTPAAERMSRVDAFQGGSGDVFLISLKAGGVGLNLVAADHVIHLDPWWNPATLAQASDRAHRIGQTRSVTVIRLVAQGTIEEAILALHAAKRDLADDLLEESDAAARLGAEELLALLRG